MPSLQVSHLRRDLQLLWSRAAPSTCREQFWIEDGHRFVAVVMDAGAHLVVAGIAVPKESVISYIGSWKH